MMLFSVRRCISQPIARSARPWHSPSLRPCPAPRATRSFGSTSSNLSLKRDAYEILGTSKTASASDIKKAYYQLAKKYHPDTNKESDAKEKFMEIQEAYEILSDEKKRAQYDQFGPSGFDGGYPGAGAGGFEGFQGGFPGGHADVFEQLFRNFGGMNGARSGFESVAQDTVLATRITFMEAAHGVQKPITFRALRKCGTCSGSGLKKGESAKTCTVCGGSGRRVFIRGGFHMATTCDNCGGSGKFVPKSAQCSPCGGSGRVTETQTLNVNIPAGVEDGMRIRLAGQGDVPMEGDGPAGDIHLQITVGPHPQFRRDGADVLINVDIPLSVALLGGTVRIPTVDGDVDLTIPAGTQPDERKVLRKRGVARVQSRRSSDKGDQWVTFKITIPKHLTPAQKKAIEDAFGTPSTGAAAEPDAKESSEAEDSSEQSAEPEKKKGKWSFFK
ncbi:uncharacterized protein BJ171DRAFT_487902 [Polychytrium aggregatum]|uniref:uncharacterized protein n=1 Tax=Polychytrium aggregatum TaxID=110093 RepID=UPI0022FE51C3|nr:uncharacterized protein BJ171DRAFT_487902 [Polychytrium aggregatum]KAI9208949.1 hypothetical protein BJ171DRAFT_487902 [Polychytrium aggregatum]